MSILEYHHREEQAFVWQVEKAKTRRKIHKMRKEMKAATSEAGKLRKQIERLIKKSKKEKCPSKEKTECKESVQTEKRELSTSSAEMKTADCWQVKRIQSQKTKRQRRVLVKPLTELHTQYKHQMQQSPFYVTQPKASDRNTCPCQEPENGKLIKNSIRKAYCHQLAFVNCSCKCACIGNVQKAKSKKHPEDVTWCQWIRKSVSEKRKPTRLSKRLKQVLGRDC